jgi:hypothetical protein
MSRDLDTRARRAAAGLKSAVESADFTHVPPATAPRRRPLVVALRPALIGALLLLGSAVGIALVVDSSPPPTTVAPTTTTTALEVFVMDRDGSNLRQVTRSGTGANWAPFFTPDGQRIIYASNAANPRGNNFDIFLVNVDGTGLEQVTFGETFDGFPMFSPDGTTLAFASNRNAAREGDTNVFIADWTW